MSGLDLILPGPTPLALAGGVYSALPLRVRDLRALGRPAREAREARWAPYRDLLLYEPDDDARRRWCREALALLEADGDDAGPADDWPATYLGLVLRASAPLPNGLAGRLTGSDWARVLAVGQALDPLDELYAAIDGPPSGGGGTPWPRVYAGLCEAYGFITPEAFGDLMLPQLRALTTRGEWEPGAPADGDEHGALRVLRRRAEYLGGD